MNDMTVKIGKISYINASPVYYDLDRGRLPDWLTMVPDVPSVLNRKIMTGEIKVSPISAAFYAMNHKDLLLLPDLSISCHGPVLSVILASNYPIEALSGKRVVFSPESASAASFLKMIFAQKKIAPEFSVSSVSDCTKVVQTADAVLVIGDTALTQPWETQFEHCIDLGQLWYEMTQLPFVFAVWAVRRSFAKKYPEKVTAIHHLLLASRNEGEKHISDIVVAGQQKLGVPKDTIRRYFQLLHCNLDSPKVHAMETFFRSLVEQKVLTEKPVIQFFDS
jgi:chorismate dehydratase